MNNKKKKHIKIKPATLNKDALYSAGPSASAKLTKLPIQKAKMAKKVTPCQPATNLLWLL